MVKFDKSGHMKQGNAKVVVMQWYDMVDLYVLGSNPAEGKVHSSGNV